MGSALFSPDGERVVSASFDGTARVWDVRTPALESQIAWASAAQFNPLQSPERFRLGMAPLTDVRSWPHAQSKCDQAVGAGYRSARIDLAKLLSLPDAGMLDVAYRKAAEAGDPGARRDDWPDEAWRVWRHRRAALARVLEREGMMQPVADAYDAVRDRYARSR